jgi:hypothetical protein
VLYIIPRFFSKVFANLAFFSSTHASLFLKGEVHIPSFFRRGSTSQLNLNARIAGNNSWASLTGDPTIDLKASIIHKKINQIIDTKWI